MNRQAQIKKHFSIANITGLNLRLETAHSEPKLAISKMIATNDGLFFVAVESTDIVGTIMAGYDGHRDWLYSVAVDPNKRLSGLASSLVHHAEKALADLGCIKSTSNCLLQMKQLPLSTNLLATQLSLA